MEAPQNPNVSWTYLLLDAHLKVTAVVNPDRRLFFGQVIVPDKLLSELICVGQHQAQARKIIDAIRHAMTLKKTQQIEYRSDMPGSLLTVTAFAECMDDGTVCLRTATLNDDEKFATTRIDESPKGTPLAGGGKFRRSQMTKLHSTTITIR